MVLVFHGGYGALIGLGAPFSGVFPAAVAVFLDGTIVRLAIGPALLVLAGRWNWWPGSHVPSDTSD